MNHVTFPLSYADISKSANFDISRNADIDSKLIH